MDLESATACRPDPSSTAGGGKIDRLQFRPYNSLMPGNQVERLTQRRIRMRTLICLVTLVTALLPAGIGSAAAAKLNVLFIAVDDMNNDL